MMKKKTRLLLGFLAVSALNLNGAEPLASWDFDKGRNIDTEAGVTEFTRTKSLDFEGTLSTGKTKLKLNIDAKADPMRVFTASPRKQALRTGIDGKNQFSADGKFAKPLSKEAGAISMWIAPENWNGTQRGPFRIFFAAEDKMPRSNELLLYKNGASNQILFLIGNNDSKQWSSIGRSVWDWKQGEWHFVCASWDKEYLYLYIDGKRFEAKRKSLPDADYNFFHVGSRKWKNEGGLTQIDNLMIFDKTLSLEEMDAIYRKSQTLKNDRLAPITYHLGIKTPAIDGKIGEFEYSATSNATFNIKTLTLDNSCRWAFSRDDKKFYFAAETMAPQRKNAALGRDGKLWEDESVEFHLQYNDKRWQFILNSDSTFFDSHMNDPEWNIKHLEQKHTVSGDKWVLEGAIAFADLGINPQEGDRIYAALCRGGNNAFLLTSSPLLRHFLDFANFSKLILTANAKPVRIDYRVVPGNEGKLDLSIATLKGTKGSVKFDGMDIRKRKLAGTTESFTEKGNLSEAVIRTSAMAREGWISYQTALDSNDSAAANFSFLSADKIKVSYLRTHIKDQKLETALQITPPIAADTKFEQILKDKNGKIVLQHSTVAGEKNKTKQAISLLWDISKLAPGDYDYYLNITEGGKTKPAHHQYFMKPAEKMPWHGFAGGFSDKVPAPWHTPKINGSAISCLMQTFDFSGSLFPKNIIAENMPVISAPIALRINGKKQVLPGTFEIVSKNEQGVKFRSSAASGDLAFQITGSIEYDGFCQLAFHYAPQKNAPVKLQNLALVFDLTPDQSKYHLEYEPGDDVPRADNVKKYYQKDFLDHPCFWIGNAERGLFLGADSLRGSHLRNAGKTLYFNRTPKGTELVLNFVDTPFTLDKGRTINFYLHPTPVKPVPPKFTRPFMYRGGVNSYRLRTNYSKVFNSYQRRFNDLEGMKRTFNRKPTHYVHGIYNAIYGISPFTPEWPYYIEKWISSPPGPGQYKLDYPLNTEAARNQNMWAFACVNCRDFMEWHLYYINDLVQDKELGLKDMYFDMAYPRSCDNTFHGCGWIDDFGTLRKTYPILANREFTKRIAKILKDKNPDSVLMFHPSGEPIAPLYGLVDVCVDGERFVSKIARDEAYYSTFTPELMQSTFLGKQNGTVNVYISQLARSASFFNPAKVKNWTKKDKGPKEVHAVRHFLGYCLLHDQHPHAGSCIYIEGERMENQLYGLGWNDGNITFYPYWRANCPVRTDAKNVLVSAYKLPKGMLAVVLNDDPKQTVTAVLSKPAGYNGRIYDLESGAAMTEAKVDLPPKGLRLIVFE